MGLLAAYRATGADLPRQDPVPYHGVLVEGWYWRFTDAATGRVVVALLGVNRAPDGVWGTLALAGHPGGFLRTAVAPVAHAARDRYALRADAADGTPLLRADADALHVTLGPDAQLHVVLADRVGWPGGALWGGVGPAHSVPALSQYWHPHVLGATVRGAATLGADEVALDGAQAYAEKNWGAGGFPPAWWWGQSQGFDDPEVCVAFAGGRAGLGPLQTTATSLVVRAGGELVRLVRPLQPIAVDVGEDGWRVRGRGLRCAVEVEGHAAGTTAHALPVPVARERRNVDGAAQHLAGELAVTLRRGARVVYRGTSTLAGLERGEAPRG